MSDFDPASVPVSPAATVMLIRDAPGIEVLMLRRNARSIFAADMWVFPGGRVEDADRDESLYSRISGLDIARAVSRLELPDAAAYWIATVRETFEEAGVLVARDKENQSLKPEFLTTYEMAEWRRRFNRGTASMRELLDATGLLLDGTELEYAARFVTPEGPPRRFDARFFLAHMPQDQTASVDNSEAVNHVWISPTDALTRHRADDMEMMTPTVACLKRLANYRSSEDAISAARSREGPEQMRVDPAVDGADRIVFVGDPRFEESYEVPELGWLWF